MGAAKRAPIPTPAPSPEHVAQALRLRQDESVFGTATSLCGFFTGDLGAPIACDGFGGICVQDASNSARGCCSSPYTNCALPTSCVARSQACTGDCEGDPLVTRCTDPAYPFCRTIAFTNEDDGHTQSSIDCVVNTDMDVGAQVTPTVTNQLPLVYYSTYPTDLPEVSDTSLLLAIVSSESASEASENSEFQQTRSGASSSSSSSSSAAGSAPTESSFVTAGGANANSTSSSSGGGLSHGATIAIAVCASVVGVALIAAVTFLVWKKRKQSARAAAEPTDMFHPSNFDQFSKVDDDTLAQMRRFSDDGTVAMTAAGRTNDEYRPQAY